MMQSAYDVIVLGCGAGGYAAAIRASQLGGKVALVEGGEVGGTCVNRGCIPSKVWLRAATVLKTIHMGEDFGIKATVNEVDLKTIVERKEAVGSEIRMGMEALLGNNGVELIRGHGALKNAREINVEGKAITAKNIILATGSSLAKPEIPGLEAAAMTTDEVFAMTETPTSVLIWGDAGPIEVEMATLLNAFGSKVHLISQHRRILPKEDGETGQRLAQALREQGIEVKTKVTLDAVKKTRDGFEARLSGKNEVTIKVKKILVTARQPNIGDLGLSSVGVLQNEDGSVRVNEYLQTSIEGVYAIGDLIGGWMNSHSASAMGVTAAENGMGPSNIFPFQIVPRGIWTIPQIGAVGLSEEEAENGGFEVGTGSFPYSINGLAMGYGEVDGAVKIVFDAESQELLGIHIVGSNATELIGEAVMALQLECTTDELAHTMRVHPTFSETIMDAGRDASKWALYLPKG